MPTDPSLLLVDLGGVFFHYDFTRAIDHWAAVSGTDSRTLKNRFRIDPAFEAFERGDITPADYLAHLRTLLGIDLPDADLTAGWNSIFGPVNHDLITLLRRLDPRVLIPIGVSNTNVLHASQWRHYRKGLRSIKHEIRKRFK